MAHIINYESRKKNSYGEKLDVLIISDRKIRNNIRNDLYNKIKLINPTISEDKISANNIYLIIKNADEIRGISPYMFDLIIVLNKTIPLDFHQYIYPIINQKRRSGEPMTKIIYLPLVYEYIDKLKCEGFYFEDSEWSEETYISDLRENKLERILKNNSYE